MVYGLWFMVYGSWFSVYSLGERVVSDQGGGFKVQVWGNSGFRVEGQGFRVQGLGFSVQGSGFGVQGLGEVVREISRGREAVTSGPP